MEVVIDSGSSMQFDDVLTSPKNCREEERALSGLFPTNIDESIDSFLNDANDLEGYRNYSSSNRQAMVEAHYRAMNKYQTYDYVLETQNNIYKFKAGGYTLWDMFELADTISDRSDPDTELSQLQHALQTAEAARRCFPGEEYDWFHLTALIHDLGKVLELDLGGSYPKGGLPQWSVCGDIFPVGCAFDKESNLFPEFFEDNPDSCHPVYSTKYGIYKPKCGLDSVTFAFGHDNYLATVLQGTRLPDLALRIIRYHSFYAWHSRGGYRHLCNDTDMQALEWVQRFQKCDLYSKVDTTVDLEAALPYYRAICEKYIGNDTLLQL
eukprot:Rmarinus@m.22263